MAKMEPDHEFVKYIIESLVNNPDKVEVKREVDQMGVLITVKVDPTDMGLLIGRAGSTAKAIRTLARIVGLRNSARVNLRIVEPEGSTHAAAGGTGAPAAAAPAPAGKTKDVDDVVSELGV